MAPTTFSIVLDNPSAAYFPGQAITGKVILALDQDKNTQGLKLKFNGEAEVSWQETQGQNTSRGYNGEESYFHEKIVLIGDEKNTDVMIPAGRHEYPFTFQLPQNLPSSFEGEFGHVRYFIEAVVKRSWKFDYNTKIMFSVNALVDLNLQPVYAEPQEMSKEKSICCLCCKEGPISMKVELARLGYVPGESIKFSVDATNSSSRPVSAIVVYFIREISYKAQGKTKRVTEELIKARGPEVQPFLSESWKNQIQIPPVPPSDLGGCKVISLEYLLKCKLDIPSSIDLKKKIPIFVGTVPFTSFLPECSRIPSPKEKEAMEPTTPPFPLISKYPDMPHPIFQEAKAYGSNDKNDDCEDGNDKKSGNTTPCPPSRATTPLLPGDAEFSFIPKYATYDYGWKFQLNVPDQNGFK